MDTIIKLNGQTAGRDKIARLVQYLSRLLWYRFQQQNKNGVQSLKNIEYQLSTFRKLLRFGRCVDSMYSTLAVLGHSDSTVKFTITLSKINNALFLLADHILWLGRADVANIDTDKWSQISNKYWLYSITMNLIRDFYEIYQILKADKYKISPKRCENLNDLFKMGSRAFLCINQSPSVAIDTVKNCCDFFIPLASLGYVKLSPGTIGLLGVISSVAGLITLIEPLKKLSPA